MDEPNPHRAERLANAALFFAHVSEHFGVAKLFRLLYLLDVMHVQRTGSSVTGESYRAWAFGPAPEELYGSQQRADSPLRTWFQFEPNPGIDSFGFKLAPRRDYVLQSFTPWQSELVFTLGMRHREDAFGAIPLSVDGEAYARTWDGGAGTGRLVPFQRVLKARQFPDTVMVRDAGSTLVDSRL